MSLKTWKEEFYPAEAHKVSKDEALDHSLRKWEGLLKKNLKRHKMYIEFRSICENDNPIEFLEFNSSTCALCVHYYRRKSDNPCLKCPLAIVLGEELDDREACRHPYRRLFLRNPLPMIRALRKVKDHAKEKQK